MLPYWVKTQILRRKGLTSPQLYQFEHELEPTQSYLEAKQASASENEKAELHSNALAEAHGDSRPQELASEKREEV